MTCISACSLWRATCGSRNLPCCTRPAPAAPLQGTTLLRNVPWTLRTLLYSCCAISLLSTRGAACRSRRRAPPSAGKPSLPVSMHLEGQACMPHRLHCLPLQQQVWWRIWEPAVTSHPSHLLLTPALHTCPTHLQLRPGGTQGQPAAHGGGARAVQRRRHPRRGAGHHGGVWPAVSRVA